MAELTSLARAQSIRVIVIPFPMLAGLAEKPYPFYGYIRTVCDAAQAEGAECLDVVPVLQQLEAPMTVSIIENHPSSHVYMKIAEQVVELL